MSGHKKDDGRADARHKETSGVTEGARTELSTGTAALNLSEWLGLVYRILASKYGISQEDFPDWDWVEAFEDGLSPREAFDAMHEDHFGDSFDNINGQFGVGA
jgi:hypothetical protein